MQLLLLYVKGMAIVSSVVLLRGIMIKWKNTIRKYVFCVEFCFSQFDHRSSFSFLLFLIVSSFLPDRLPWHIQRVTSHMLLTLLRRWEFKLWYAKAKLSVALLKKTGKGGSWSSMLNGRRGCSSWCANAVFLQQKKLAHHMLLPITRVHTRMLLLAVTLSSKQYIPGVCRMVLIPKWSNVAVFLQTKT